MSSRLRTGSVLTGALLVLFYGCNATPQGEPQDRARDKRPLLGFGVIAGDDPGLRYRGYQPLIDHLTNRTPFLFRLSLGRNAEDMLLYVEERMAEVVPLGALDYLEAHSQFGAVPLVRPLNRNGQPVSHSVFVVREDSPLQSLPDLKGRSLALGPFHSTLSNLIPKDELLQVGVEFDELGGVEHLDSDETIAAAVLEGRFDAGAVEERVAYRYQDRGLAAMHVSDPVPSGPLVVRGDLPPSVILAIRDALLNLDFAGVEVRARWDENVRYGFVPAADADYDPVREIVSRASERCGGACHSGVVY